MKKKQSLYKIERQKRPLNVPFRWIALGCVVIGIVTAVIVGNVLKKTLEKDGKSDPDGTETDPAPRVQITVPDAVFTPFEWGAKIPSGETPAGITLLLSDASGRLQYQSEVQETLGWETAGETLLPDEMLRLNLAYSEICGVFSARFQTYSGDDVRTAQSLREISLLNEFVRYGAKEILISGLDVGSHPDEVTRYLTSLRGVLPDCRIGIAVPAGTAGAKILSLLSICDYCLLDATQRDAAQDPAEYLSANRYLLSQYDLGVLTNADDTALLTLLSEGGLPVRAVKLPPAPIPEETEETVESETQAPEE